MISTLQKLAGIGNQISDNKASSINFNVNLPITITVLKHIDYGRYKLKLGRKELTTKSQKNLREGKSYWGNFFEAKGGILTISNLYLQPSIFQSYANFLDVSIEILMQKTVSYDIFKTFLIENLSHDHISKEDFTILSQMLMALNKSVIHLPFLQEGKKALLQFLPSGECLKFYAAFENLGPIEGTIALSNGKITTKIDVMYEKTLYYLEKEAHKLGIITQLSLQNDIGPLYDFNDLVLDLKG